MKVLELVVEGDTDNEIAARLGYAPRTVNKMLERFYQSKGLRNRAAAAAWFVRARGIHGS